MLHQKAGNQDQPNAPKKRLKLTKKVQEIRTTNQTGDTGNDVEEIRTTNQGGETRNLPLVKKGY